MRHPDAQLTAAEKQCCKEMAGIADKMRQACQCLTLAAKRPFNRLMIYAFFNLSSLYSHLVISAADFPPVMAWRAVRPISLRGCQNTLASTCDTRRFRSAEDLVSHSCSNYASVMRCSSLEEKLWDFYPQIWTPFPVSRSAARTILE